MAESVYIHIPFCKSKCHYCSFISFNKLHLKEHYLTSLSKEIKHNYKNEILKTLYFGGGTPSVLSAKEFQLLLNHFKINNKTEITTELNPNDCNFQYLKELKEIGINRISLGCQTFDNKILKQINRRHNAQQVINAIENAKAAGFKNISLDFIYGLPEQTPEMFYTDLKQALTLGIQHISLYGLKLEEGSYFYNHQPKNLPDDDTQADMYLGAIKLLSNRGFEHYEVSNFSLPDFNSQHNLTYWNNEEYYGFGVAAHGYINGIRYGNKITIETYIENPLEHLETKILSAQEKLEEEIFLGFRRMKGIDINQINTKYGINFIEKYGKILNKYENLNLLVKTSDGYKLTPNGILVSNVILADFLE